MNHLHPQIKFVALVSQAGCPWRSKTWGIFGFKASGSMWTNGTVILWVFSSRSKTSSHFLTLVARKNDAPKSVRATMLVDPNIKEPVHFNNGKIKSSMKIRLKQDPLSQMKAHVWIDTAREESCPVMSQYLQIVFCSTQVVLSNGAACSKGKLGSSECILDAGAIPRWTAKAWRRPSTTGAKLVATCYEAMNLLPVFRSPWPITIDAFETSPKCGCWVIWPSPMHSASTMIDESLSWIVTAGCQTNNPSGHSKVWQCLLHYKLGRLYTSMSM